MVCGRFGEDGATRLGTVGDDKIYQRQSRDTRTSDQPELKFNAKQD